MRVDSKAATEGVEVLLRRTVCPASTSPPGGDES